MDRLACDYWDAGRCRSCSLIEMPYADQLARKDDAVRTVLPMVPERAWEPPQASAPAYFRNKAKLVVGGRTGAVTVGILDRQQQGVDLRECALHEGELRAGISAVAGVLNELRLVPYDVPARSGEVKHVLLTRSPDGELMLRLVMRTRHHVDHIRAHLDTIRNALPGVRVVSVNLLPEHKAVLEGDEEVLLTDADVLPMRINDLTLHLGVRSFFQTNTAVAAALYATAREWTADLHLTSVADLFCGVGGFALHLAAPGREVIGVETSSAAIAAARLTRTSTQVRFLNADATTYLQENPAPELVVVNPPRRGIATLAADLERSDVAHVLYSSCNPVSLAADLASMPSMYAVRARVFDMFPQTTHSEVLVLLSRR